MISRYWHTLRHLRPVQVYGRLWFRLYRPRPDSRPAPAVRPMQGRWMPPVDKPASMLGPKTFRFLNATYELAPGPDAWNDSARDKLWLYNLHYFDDLNAAPSPPTPPPRWGEATIPAAQAPSLPYAPPVGENWGERDPTGPTLRLQWHLALLKRWVAESPPGHGNGWEPYPTSLRIVNWIKWVLSCSHARGGVSFVLPPACLQSLAVQARWLRRRLEYHLLGNHLFANAKALVFAGAFFFGPEPDRWRQLGLRLLARELDEQILPDGGHFERSPMYHAILLEDVLDLINLAGANPGLCAVDGAKLVAHWRATATAMLRWLAVMTHPDGGISFFNDAAMGIAPPLAELVAYAERLGIAAEVVPTSPCCWLRDSGYVRLAAGPAVALLDIALIGPDYLPGHAHADTLSFELSLFGQRLIVNGGTSRYGNGPERLAERGTAAHSTVQIDGADSSEVWGGFRVARRARPFEIKVGTGGGGLHEVSAAHDGYRRLSGRPVHRRAWRLTARHLAVIDTIEGRFEEAVARFHLHPAIRIVDAEAGGGDVPCHRHAGQLLLPGGQRVTWRVSAGVARLVPHHWWPQFGLSLPSQCLELTFIEGQCRLDLAWDEGEWETESRRPDPEGANTPLG